MRIVHLLNWDLKSIESILEDIKKQGFDGIQINPMQPYKEEKDFHWWSSYQPLGFRIGNRFGDKEALTSLCKKANELGINIIVDVVLNHTANLSGEENLVPHYNVDDELTGNPAFWKKREMLINGDIREDAVKKNIGLPGLDLSNPDLVKIVFRYLDELKECGVKGFRFDAAKHIGLPNDGVDFFSLVRHYLKDNKLFGYGEFLGGYPSWQEEFATYIPILTHFTSNIKDRNKHYTFIESHDTFLNKAWDTTSNFKTGQLINLQGLLNNKFNNTLYYVRPKYYPYNPDGKIPSQHISMPDYFEPDFLVDKRFKDINDDHNRSLILK